ncbi:hypothetical protein [Enterovirga rhinocerotis]|uniref:Uncharacterized protein n=1 Tax=Enterovirga rhinocerotis TaxID=1339210 RepID=A0A4R7BWP2_9HYPH|nr:hypothetical protein [Enterovirga rhinocerotis]TDR89105.1 hypothetical protein EV668_3593 [Enterovirga rhinocerotis]
MTIVALSTAQEARGLAFSRERICDAIEFLIGVLDLLDDDPDLEPDACFEGFLQADIRGGANVRVA